MDYKRGDLGQEEGDLLLPSEILELKHELSSMYSLILLPSHNIYRQAEREVVIL